MSRDYREKDVNGILTDGKMFKPTTVTVRMTRDKRGSSLSLNAYNVMIQIPLEQVEDIIRISDKQ